MARDPGHSFTNRSGTRTRSSPSTRRPAAEPALLPRPRIVHRIIGPPTRHDGIRMGVMDKTGWRQDQTRADPQTYSLVYVLRGGGRYAGRDGRWTPLRSGDCFQRTPGVVHTTEIDPDSGWREIYIDLGRGLPLSLLDLDLLRREPATWHWGLSASRIHRLDALLTALEKAQEVDLPDMVTRCQGLVMEAARCQRTAGDMADAFDLLRRFCDETFDHRIDFREFCARRKLPYESLRKDFTRRIGLSPGRYRVKRRIERACQLLLTTDDGLLPISEQLGYSSQYEFNSQFRAWMGVPPMRWRRAHRPS